MKRRIVIDIELKCSSLSKDSLEENFDGILDDILFSIGDLVYHYDEDGEEHTIDISSEHDVEELG
jgi:hypothetical protein